MIFDSKACIFALVLITVLMISGCIQTNDNQDINLSNDVENQTNSCGICQGDADICKQYKCVDGDCIIVELSNCCGNGICENNENYGNCSDCLSEAEYKFERIEHESCKDEGRANILAFLDMEHCKFSVELKPMLDQLENEFGEEVNITYFYMDYSQAKTYPLTIEYGVPGTPYVFFDCYIKYLGSNVYSGRDINSLRTITEDIISGFLL